MVETEELAALASAYGVATRYTDWRGEVTPVPPDTLVAVLAALDVDASTPEAIDAALSEARLSPWRRTLPPVTVTEAGRAGRDATTVPVRAPEGSRVRAWIELEGGDRRDDLSEFAVYVSPVEVDGVLVAETTLRLPEDLPLGWHRLLVRCGSHDAEMPLVVTPARVDMPRSLENRRSWGLMAQLYSVRSLRSWGMGDLGDLAELVELAGRELGAGMLLINPLHAAGPVPPIEPSPYFPVSRRFADPLYLRVEDVPEYGELSGAARERVQGLAAPLREANRTTGLLDRDAVWEAKRGALELIFQTSLSPERRAEFTAFREREGAALREFATWCALAERHGLPWQQWPVELQDPASAAVERARAELDQRVEFYMWVQWHLDVQLHAAQRAAGGAGMAIGVVHDLAVGVSAGGADSWRLGGTLASGVTEGAPPDAFNQQGQDWGQPPWRPDRLADSGYAPFREMLRCAFRHSGGLRVDHIMGLFRLWWIPEGMPSWAGTYVRYDHEALIGILALEANRAGALVIGEDLGTVEPWVRDYLAQRGVFGTSMLWFEKDELDRPRPPATWRELCLATVATHDMPPITGYLAGEHIDLRQRLDLLARSAETEREEGEVARRAWLRELDDQGLLEPGAGQWGLVLALHAFLTRTPARLLGAALTDAVGERRTQNQPGTTTEYPNWRLPLADDAGRAVLLDDLANSPRLHQLARVFSEGLGSPMAETLR